MRLLLLGLLVVAAPAAAVGVHDQGPRELSGAATDLVERRAVLDLWDAGQPKRGFALRLAPDGDDLPGLEARWRPLHGPEGRWQPLAQARVVAGGERAAQDRGWDGLYEFAVRVRLPNAPEARLAVLVVEDAPGRDALALTTRLRAATLSLAGSVEAGPEGARIRATLEGPKAPSAVEAHAGAGRVVLASANGTWEGVAPAGASRVQLVARFADGGVLEGPVLEVPGAPDAEPATPAPSPGPLEQPRAVEPARPPAARGTAEEPGAKAPDRAPAPAAAPPRRGLPGAPISLLLASLALAALLGRGTRPPSL